MANQSGKNQVEMLSFDDGDSDNHKVVILNIFRKLAKKDAKRFPDNPPYGGADIDEVFLQRLAHHGVSSEFVNEPDLRL